MSPLPSLTALGTAAAGPPGSGTNLPTSVLVAATVSAVFSTLLSLATVYLQLKHYHRPRLQRFVVRILCMVPIYSLSSLISLYSLDLAFFVDAVRDIYEAFVIYCFFSLLVEYLGGERSLIILLHGREPVKHPWPVSLFLPPMDASDPFTFLGLKRGILQYVQLKPILAATTVVLKATGTYKDGSLSRDSGYTYVSIAYNLSVSISLYCLAMFWVTTHDDLQPFRPMPKFLCVKGIIFASFWQGFGVSVLVALGWLRSSRYETEQLSLAIQDTLICFEMPLFAFLHLYAFSYTDYIDSNHVYCGRLPITYALRDAFGCKDLWLDSLTTLRGTGFSYRTFEPASSTVHSFGPTLDRRLRAGLRYSSGGSRKYWLSHPGPSEDAYGRRGAAGWKARPLHQAKRVLERRVDVREGYAPLSADEERDVVHVEREVGQAAGEADDGGPRHAKEETRRDKALGWWEGTREYDELSSEDESEPESLEFKGPEEDDLERELEDVYAEAKGMEFGDWSYPVVDASRESARRRMREEEDAIFSGKFSRRSSTKGKERGTRRSQQQRPLAQHRHASYGALAERSPPLPDHPHQTSSPSDPSTSADHPRPLGDSIVSGASHLLHSILPGTSAPPSECESPGHSSGARRRQQEEQSRLPPDAVDLVVEDPQAEEEEQIRQRRRGEPMGKKTRVYRKTWVPPEERGEVLQKGDEVRDPVEGETARVKDIVERHAEEDGPPPAGGEGGDDVVRVAVKEEEPIHVWMLRPPLARLPRAFALRVPLRSSSSVTVRPTSSPSVHSRLMPASTPPPWAEWRSDPPSSTSATSTMLVNQSKLARLPVPKLDETLELLLESCRPLAGSRAELDALQRKMEEFRKEGGLGRELQTRLEQRREQDGVRNWLAEWWDTQAYMAYRDSVVINVSYYFGFDRLPQAPPATPNPPAQDPAYVAASIAKTALEFRRLIATGVLEPELAGRTKEDGELCMESYKWAFNACRIPASPSDYAIKTPETASDAQHFVVVKRNRFYKVSVADERGNEYSVEHLRSAIQKIVEESEKLEKAPPVGVLTGINRDRWAEAHGHLLSDSSNHATLRSIHTSAFIISLDEATPSPHDSNAGMVEFSERLWHGRDEGGNRWWDKPLQWVVFRNGEAGFIGEHSCMDGTPTARLNDFLTMRLLTSEPFPPSSASSSPPTPSPLPFSLDSTALTCVANAEKEFAEHIAPYDVFYLSYRKYGKDEIKQKKTSPDGWVQMLFQLAYYMTHGRATATYEAAQTRRFQLGRTETVRILTSPSLAFVRAMVDPASPPMSTPDKLELFRAAVKQHGGDMKRASGGTGIDRHLFGLKMIASEAPGMAKDALGEGQLLADALVKESGTWRMSTSQIYIRHSPSYGWGPVQPDGYGLPYMIHPESLQLTVTCRRSMKGQELIDNFGKAADMLMELHEEGERWGGKM
ncbi:hypothetical protein JCM21900_002182 [Sporobolomyces salmonicolor]